ncbi:MAG: hypothetical protein HND52_18885 [Ignavibacteriae bacterium]|nr:hypothetical protein [Ignavibacteriota bacterium]NOH00032.1 hypothetical protein [Ignavibacteriota bacterium]
MIIDKKSQKKISRIKQAELKNKHIQQPEISKSNIVVGEKYFLKDINEIEKNFLLKVGMGISYAVVISFLVFKLLA